MPDVTITAVEYQILRALALAAADSGPEINAAEVHDLCRDVDARNGIVRDTVYIIWTVREGTQPRERFPQDWPPRYKAVLEFTERMVAREDVEELVRKRDPNPEQVLVTRDPAYELGLQTLAEFFR